MPPFRDMYSNWLLKQEDNVIRKKSVIKHIFLTVWITTNWKILQEMEKPDHLTCLLKNLYAGQEATLRTGHRTTDWFQTGESVQQGCILSPCFFNFYAEYIM